jgi:hypothetical protein
MSAEIKKEIQLEIAHVLFIDDGRSRAGARIERFRLRSAPKPEK